jgi:hypothetical protein
MRALKDQHLHRDEHLVSAALFYSVTALAGAVTALSNNVAAEFLGREPTREIIFDFLLPWGWGTGLSPSLALIVLVIVIAFLLARAVGPLRLWRWTLTVGGFLFMLGQLGEPHTYHLFSSKGVLVFHVFIAVVMVVLPGLMVITGIRALRAARRAKLRSIMELS